MMRMMMCGVYARSSDCGWRLRLLHVQQHQWQAMYRRCAVWWPLMSLLFPLLSLSLLGLLLLPLRSLRLLLVRAPVTLLKQRRLVSADWRQWLPMTVRYRCLSR